MNYPHLPTVLHEVERLTGQAEQLRPFWDALLEQARAVCAQIQARIEQATGDNDPSGQTLDPDGLVSWPQP
jgi:hypothetical protein